MVDQRRALPLGGSLTLAVLCIMLFENVPAAAAWGLPGSKSAPVHLGGGFQIENMDAFAMTVGAMVLSVIR
jgi:hypothetical protein